MICNNKVDVPDGIGNAAKKRPGRPANAVAQDRQITGEKFRELVATASAQMLKAHFRKSWNAHQNLRKRTRPQRKTSLHELHADLRDFPAFLLAMGGPAPSAEASIDRIDGANPLYGPGLIRWATKAEQANNRVTNIIVEWRGLTKTLAEWARCAGISYETLKKRHRRNVPTAGLFQGAKVKKYAPTLGELKDQSSPQSISGEVPFAMAVPPPHPAAGGWPEGLNQRSFEAGYVQAMSRVPKGSRRMSRITFALWIVESILGDLRRHLPLACFSSHFRDEMSAEGVAELWCNWRGTVELKDYLHHAPIAVTLWSAFRAEVASDARKSRHVGDVEQYVRSAEISMRGLVKAKKCIKPGEAWRRFHTDGG